jgi:glycerophosphoryl diester phosphodiesterase
VRSRRLVVGTCLVSGLLAMPGTATASADAPPGPSGTMNVAHRGSAGEAPEHTLAALDRAVADRADRLSIDVRLTEDGVPIVMHDDSLARTTNVEEVFPDASSYSTRAFLLSDIRRLDAGGWFEDGRFAGSRVLTFDEVLTELAGSPVGLTVEVKRPNDAEGVDGIGAAVMEVLRRHPGWTRARPGLGPRLVLESFQWTFLDDMHAAYPELPLVLLGNVRAEDMDGRPYADEIDVPLRWLTQDLLDAARSRGKRVGVWTVNDPGSIESLAGVGAVTSDLPGLVHDILGRLTRSWSGTTWPVEARPAAAALTFLGTRVLDDEPVQVRLLATDGTASPVRWRHVDVQVRHGTTWTTVVATATDAHGRATVSLPKVDGLSVRTVVGGRVLGESVAPLGRPRVVPPVGAPAPSYRLAAQPVTATAGAQPRITGLSASTWRQLVGRSWRRGCPVARSGLRLLTVSYWGFDGLRHRGSLVVARHTAVQLGRVFSTLYDRGRPLRSIRRVEELGTWTTSVGRAVRGDATFGFTCHRTPGDVRPVGSHARGTVVTVNPWENPTRTGASGSPNTWWLHRAQSLPDTPAQSDDVVAAFAEQGFAWNGRAGRSSEFRDVR